MTSVPLTAEHMSEIPEPRANPNAQFLAGDLPHLASDKSRLGGSLAVSLGSHIGGFLHAPGPGGGGGGGGNKSPDPPKKAELPGKEKITVPVAKPPTLIPEPPKKEEPKPVAQLNIPAVTTSNGVQE